MSETYVTMKVREAVRAAQGNRAQAQRLLIAWALSDEQLLAGLCKPFLPAIAGDAIQRALRGAGAAPMPAPIRSAPSPARGGGGRQAKALSPQMLDAILSRMGGGASVAEAAAAVAPQTMRDVLRQRAASAPAPADDPEHQAESLKALAAAFRGRK